LSMKVMETGSIIVQRQTLRESGVDSKEDLVGLYQRVYGEVWPVP